MNVKKVLSIAGKVFMVVFFAFVIWRITISGDESTLSEFTPTSASAQIYRTDGSLNVLTNDVVSDISDGGYFSAYAVYYIPETKELQVTVKYNRNTVSVLGDVDINAYTVDTSVEAVTEEVTESDGGDDEENKDKVDRLHDGTYYGYPVSDPMTPIVVKTEDKMFYSYRKLIFENVEIDDYANVMLTLSGVGDYTDEHVSLAIHFAEQPFETYKLSKNDKKALSSYVEETK